MKIVKAIAAIGIVLLLIVFFIHLVNEFLAVKSTEKTIQNLPKIEQKLKKAVQEKEDQLKQTEGDEEKKEDQE
ncbi:MAG: hypothetical protein ACE14Q_00340 [Acidobacteriota bacterium]|nr:hypothetical protein [Thermoanaerobaculaceae bacterium]